MERDRMLVIGAGPMGSEHARAAMALGLAPTVLARSPERAAAACEAGIPARVGAAADWLAQQGPPDLAVVAVGVEALAEVTAGLIEGGVRRILVEKPGGLDSNQIGALDRAATAAGAEVFIAYNRRFYPSVIEARRRLAQAGGATSLRFDFTELAWRVADLASPAAVKASWLYANSTHVIDTAFFLAGEPASLQAQAAGGLDWHAAGSGFSGAGATGQGAVFSYLADWSAPGRWSIDVRSAAERLVLEPLEGLLRQAPRTFTLEAVAIDDAADGGLKPGVLGQMKAFALGEGAESLMPLSRQAERARDVYDTILRGGVWSAA